MKKAVQLKVLLWVEGEDTPSHNFAKSSIEAIRGFLTNARAGSPEVTIRVKKIEESPSDDDDDNKSGDTF